MSETPEQMTAEQRDGLREQLEGRLRGSFDEGDSGDYWLHQVLTESLQALSEVDRLTAKVAEQAAEIEMLRVTRNPDHDTCRAVEQRLREANRRLQAEGPALGRDKLIAAQQAKLAEAEAKLRAVEALRDDVLKRLANWAVANKHERQQGKLPTHLNPYTVALWLGVKEDELTDIIEAKP